MGRYSVHARVEAACKLYMCSQEKDSAADYFNRFKQLVESYKSLGGEPGICEESIREALLEDELDPKTATEEQVKTAKAKASETHLAVQFLLGCNRKRCGALVAEAINAYHRGDNHYPRTLDTALRQLSEFEPTGEISTYNDRQGSGMAFFQNGEPNPGRGGRGG
eukprot:scaffold4455_cov109-Cylindrotheca_fusiformis.AAC.1